MIIEVLKQVYGKKLNGKLLKSVDELFIGARPNEDEKAIFITRFNECAVTIGCKFPIWDFDSFNHTVTIKTEKGNYKACLGDFAAMYKEYIEFEQVGKGERVAQGYRVYIDKMVSCAKVKTWKSHTGTNSINPYKKLSAKRKKEIEYLALPENYEYWLDRVNDKLKSKGIPFYFSMEAFGETNYKFSQPCVLINEQKYYGATFDNLLERADEFIKGWIRCDKERRNELIEMWNAYEYRNTKIY